jgi:hypothetical protein
MVNQRWYVVALFESSRHGIVWRFVAHRGAVGEVAAGTLQPAAPWWREALSQHVSTLAAWQCASDNQREARRGRGNQFALITVAGGDAMYA